MGTLSNRCLIQELAKDAPTWCQRIPEGSRNDFDAINVILQDPDQAILRNELYCDLLTRIGKTAFVKNSLNNPLASFKNGTFAYGDVFQEISTDVIESYQFEGYTKAGPSVDQFENFDTTVEADYHRINRREFYPITIPDVRLRTAFLSANGLSSLMSQQLGQLNKSNTADEFIYAKRALLEFYTNTSRPVKPGQKLPVPDISVDGVTADNMREFNESIRLRVSQMAFNSRDFNAHGFLTAVQPADMVIIMNYQYGVKNDTRYLSNLFNPELTRIRIPVIDVDDFGEGDNYDGDKIIGIVCDRRFLQIYNTLFSLKTNENARALTSNYFLHVHQLYACSAFMPVVYLVAKK